MLWGPRTGRPQQQQPRAEPCLRCVGPCQPTAAVGILHRDGSCKPRLRCAGRPREGGVPLGQRDRGPEAVRRLQDPEVIRVSMLEGSLYLLHGSSVITCRISPPFNEVIRVVVLEDSLYFLHGLYLHHDHLQDLPAAVPDRVALLRRVRGPGRRAVEHQVGAEFLRERRKRG